MNTNTQQTDENLLRHFSRELPVALNDHELQSYGKMLAEKVREEELAEDKKKQVAAEHTGRIKAIRIEIKRIADARAKGEELRPVKCAERIKGNVIEIVRLDRNEVVDTRPADLRDLQTSIPGTGVPEMPDGFDEGPRGDAMGSHGHATNGQMMTSSSGDQVYSGAPDDGDGEDHEAQADEEATPWDDDAAPADEDDGGIAGDVSDDGIADPDFGGAEARKAQADADNATVDAKPKRERSRKVNEAKVTPITSAPKKKR